MAPSLPPGTERPAVAGIPKVAVPDCPACGGGERRPRGTVRELEYSNTTTDEFHFMECGACGAWYLDPRPHGSALDIIYPPNYFAHMLAAQAQARAAGPRGGGGLFDRLRNALYRRRIAPITRYLPLTPDTRWLDVGCGEGGALRAMQAAYGMTGTGLDYSAAAIAHIRSLGFPGHAGRFEDYVPGLGESYDLVHSSHLIEHVESPLAYMEKAFDLLRPGGLCVVITPSKSAWEARVFGSRWGGLHVPRHWTLLDEASGRALGERAGFQFLEAAYSTNSGFWIWTAHHSLLRILPRSACDALFPADHRIVEPTLLNLVRNAGLTLVDGLSLLVTRRSANMLLVFRKPG